MAQGRRAGVIRGAWRFRLGVLGWGVLGWGLVLGAWGQAANTPVAETMAAGYANLTQAAEEVYRQQSGVLPDCGHSGWTCGSGAAPTAGDGTIVLYDAGAFAAVASYTALVEDVRGVREEMCGAEKAPAGAGPFQPNFAAGAADVGTLLSGAADLMNALKPTYTTQAQSLPADQAAFQAAFVAVARRKSPKVTVVLPAYVAAATGGRPGRCGDGAWAGETSFATQWRGAAEEAARIRSTMAGVTDAAEQKRLKDALEEYAAMRARYTGGGDAGADKGRPVLLAQVLVAESLRRELLAAPMQTVVVDLRVDGMSANSVAKSFFGLKTTISTGVVGHYVVSRMGAEGLTVVGSGVVDVLTKGMNDKGFGGKTTVVPGVGITAGALQ